MRQFRSQSLSRKVRFLGELETAIMEILWKEGSLSGRQVYEQLSLSRSLSLTTVLTILNRLIKKGLVRKETGWMVYLFRPAISREEWQEAVSRELLLQALKFSPEIVLSSFADILTKLPSEEFSNLMEIVKKKRHDRHGSPRS
ncbi:MAG: BlaI/MecI/CopY family transcriptional regulator [Candidatus Aminicenantales bacterium]